MHKYIPLILVVVTANYLIVRDKITFEGEDTTREETYLLPPANVLRLAGINYHTLTADLTWVSALLYFAESRHEKMIQEPKYIINYADTIIDIDGYFYAIYPWLMATFTQTRGQLTNSEIKQLQEALNKAILRYPDQYKLYYEAGILGIGHSEGRDPKVRIGELDSAISYLQRCMRLAGCPDNTAFVVSWMYNRRAQLEAEVAGRAVDREADVARERAFSLEVYPRLTDPELRARMRKQLVAMGVGEAQLDALEREQVGQVRLDYEARAPYLPLDLWALTVSPRP